MEDIKKKIEESLEKIKPYIKRDGGDVELVSVDNGIVKVRLKGACYGCPSAVYTLKMGIEEMLKADFPDIKEVIAVD